MSRPPLYMDYQATTPVDQRVLDAMLPYFTGRFGNPSSRQHSFGWIAEEAVGRSRGLIASLLGVQPGEIIFTSGATEANNLAIKGAAESLRSKGDHIITVQTEHKSVIDSCKRLEKAGFSVTYLPVDEYGKISLEGLGAAITPRTILVSVMFANNEIGTIQPITEIGRMCRDHRIVFHTDATQAVGKVSVHPDSMNIDLLSFSGHKIYGPKGIGVLFVRRRSPRVQLTPQIDGGGHERGLRSGTLNVPGIVGIATAFELAAAEQEVESARLLLLRDALWNGLHDRLPDIALNGHPTDRLPNNLNISFRGVDESALMMSLKDIALSSGSACSTESPEPSHVLHALNVPRERLHSSVRFGLGRQTTADDVEYVVQRVADTVQSLRRFSPHYSGKNEHVPSES